MHKIFLSYGRGDDEPFVRRLREGLTDLGFSVWFDSMSMPSRRLTFHQEIRDAVAACDRFVLVVGPHAAASDYVRQEWQFAWFDAERIITPILRMGDHSLVPDELKLLHCEDFRDDSQYHVHLKVLNRILSDPPPRIGELIGVPSLPTYYLSRTERLVALRDSVRSGLDSPTQFGGVVTYQKTNGISGSTRLVGVHGMGGIGKSFLASLLAHDRQVREAFPDGIVWIGLGASPEIRKRMVETHQALGGDGDIENETEGRKRLLQIFKDKSILLILDDAWHRRDVDAFDVLGPRCRALVTTRDAGLIGSIKGVPHPVELLNNEEAIHLLAVSANLERSAFPAEALEVLSQCGRLPLAVALAGSRVRAGTPWVDLRDALLEHELEFLEDMHAANTQHINLWRMIEVGVATLADDVQHRLAELAVFPADEQVPDAAIATLWQQTGGLSPRQSRKLLVELNQLSLVQIEVSSNINDGLVGKCSLHDIIRDFCIRLARKQLGTENLHHTFLLSAYKRHAADGWWIAPNDGYFFDHLRVHLIAAGRVDELADLLHELLWLEAKAEAGMAFDLLQDFQQTLSALPREHHARGAIEKLYGSFLRQSHLIQRNPTLLFQQMFNDCFWIENPLTAQFVAKPLKTGKESAVILPDQSFYRVTEKWLADKAASIHGPWLRACFPSPSQFVRQQIWSLSARESETTALAASDDLSMILTGHADGSLQIWNTTTGLLLSRIKASSSRITNVACSRSGDRVLSQDEALTVQLWDSASGDPIGVPVDLASLPSCLSLSPDGDTLLFGTSDGSLRMVTFSTSGSLDFGCPDATGDDPRLNDGNRPGSPVTHIAWRGSSHIVALGRANNGVQFLDLNTSSWIGEFAATTQGRLTALAFSPNGERFGLASIFQTRCADSYVLSEYVEDEFKAIVFLWRFPDMERQCKIEGHRLDITSLCFSMDGDRIGTVSLDGTIRVWDPAGGDEISRVPNDSPLVRGFFDSTIAQAVTLSSGFGISLWDLRDSSRDIHKLSWHGEVTDIAFSQDGSRLAVAYNTGQVRLLTLADYEAMTLGDRYTTPTRVGFSMDGQYLAALYAGVERHVVYIWDTTTGERVVGAYTGPNWLRSRPVWVTEGVDWTDFDIEGPVVREEPEFVPVPSRHKTSFALVCSRGVIGSIGDSDEFERRPWPTSPATKPVITVSVSQETVHVRASEGYSVAEVAVGPVRRVAIHPNLPILAIASGRYFHLFELVACPLQTSPPAM